MYLANAFSNKTSTKTPSPRARLLTDESADGQELGRAGGRGQPGQAQA